MAGAPLRKAMLTTLEELGKAEGISGEQWVLDQVTGGRSLRAIAKEDLKVSENMMYKWGGETDSRREKVRHARERSSHALVDECQEIADESTPVNVQVARERISIRKFKAATYDRATFGEQKAPLIAISVGDMHLTALQTVPPEPLQIASEEIEVLPATAEEPEAQ